MTAPKDMAVPATLDYRATPLDKTMRYILAGITGSDVNELTNQLYRRLEGDKAFIEAYWAEILYIFCDDKAREKVCSRRGAIVRAANADPHQTDRLRNFARSLLDFPLPGGKRLGSARVAEVREAATYYGAHAREAAWKSRWLAQIADKVSAQAAEDTPVEAVLTADDIHQMQEAARADD